MKKIFRVFALAAACAALFSCMDKPEYTRVPFVTMYRTSATISEAEGGTIYNIPVKLNNFDGATTVAYKVSGDATNGVDYKFADQSGVLNFPAGTDSLAIKVNVTGQPGVFTGDLKMKVTLASATEGVTLGKFNTFTMTIKDLDHPLSAIFGAYTMVALSYDTGSQTLVYPSWTMNISQFEGDPTKIWMDNVTYFTIAYGSYTGSAPVWGVVSDDKKTITIPLPQTTAGDLKAFGLDNLYFFAHEGLGGKYITAEASVVFKLQDDGKWVTADNFGCGHPDDLKDYPELFYDYCVNYSSYNAGYPTYFVKK